MFWPFLDCFKLFGLLFEKLGIFFKSSGHPDSSHPACLLVHDIIKTAQLKVEILAQTAFRSSPVNFRSAQIKLYNIQIIFKYKKAN